MTVLYSNILRDNHEHAGTHLSHAGLSTMATPETMEEWKALAEKLEKQNAGLKKMNAEANDDVAATEKLNSEIDSLKEENERLVKALDEKNDLIELAQSTSWQNLAGAPSLRYWWWLQVTHFRISQVRSSTPSRK